MLFWFNCKKRFAGIFCGIAAVTVSIGGHNVSAQPADTRVTFSESIREPLAPAPTNTAAVRSNRTPTLIRSQLTAAELETAMDFSIALKMRNLGELQQRIAGGEILSLDEMSSKYFPTASDRENIRAWLLARGFEVFPGAPHELSIFARGTVTRLQQVFGARFGRVQFAGEEHTSAITSPSLPSDIAGPVLSINGLQPHLHPVIHSVGKQLGPTEAIANSPPYFVSEITKAYGATLGNGAGQKIGIVINTFPSDSDLTAFWAYDSVPQSLSNIEKIQVVAGSLDPPSGEETLDASWSSGIASGAGIRIYATFDLHFDHLDQAYQRILNDIPSQPGLRQVSLSYGAGELGVPPAQMETDAQYFTSLAAAGVTVFVSSGDGGSSPNGFVQTETPANDLHVTAVGGTSLYLDPSTGGPTSETAWSGSGGGQSTIFSRPVWQGSTVPGSGRLVPDVALVADPNTGAFLVLHGQFYQYGGTSLSAPVWAGFCARLNQIRASNGTPPIAQLGPSIYPFAGSTIFRDIISGSNGVYGAGAGFDLCTGLGVPQVDTLLTALSHSQASLPKVAKDFNHDGFADLIFESPATGNHTVWLLKDGVRVGSFAILKSAPQWHIAGVADFLGNGQPSLVLENAVTRSHKIWILQNGGLQYQIWLPLNPVWHIGAAADFDGDGQADLAVENVNTGARMIWFLKGGTYSSRLFLPRIGLNWHIVAAGDFLGNGQSDLALENLFSGKRMLWVLNRGQFSYSQDLGSASSAWHIAGAADFNGDGQCDVVWENTETGRRFIWLLGGGEYLSTVYLPPLGNAWRVVNH